jgi:hypothetical protein
LGALGAGSAASREAEKAAALIVGLAGDARAVAADGAVFADGTLRCTEVRDLGVGRAAAGDEREEEQRWGKTDEHH